MSRINIGIDIIIADLYVLKKAGTIVALGENFYEQCKVQDWKDMKTG